MDEARTPRGSSSSASIILTLEDLEDSSRRSLRREMTMHFVRLDGSVILTIDRIQAKDGFQEAIRKARALDIHDLLDWTKACTFVVGSLRLRADEVFDSLTCGALLQHQRTSSASALSAQDQGWEGFVAGRDVLYVLALTLASPCRRRLPRLRGGRAEALVA